MPFNDFLYVLPPQETKWEQNLLISIDVVIRVT